MGADDGSQKSKSDRVTSVPATHVAFARLSSAVTFEFGSRLGFRRGPLSRSRLRTYITPGCASTHVRPVSRSLRGNVAPGAPRGRQLGSSECESTTSWRAGAPP